LTRIGSVDDPAQALTWVGQVLIGPDGLIYISQPQDHVVRVFDLTGRLIRRIGGRGQGPGEFERLEAIGFRGDTLYATDGALHRVSYFSLDGSFITSFRMASPLLGEAPPAIYFPTAPQVLLADGTALLTPEVPIALMASGNGTAPYVRIDRQSQVMDTIAWRRLPPLRFETVSGGERFFAPQPFRQDPLYELTSDGSGLVVIDRPTAPAGTPQAEYRVTKISPTGDTLFARAYRYTPVPLTSADLGQALSAIESRLATRPNPPGRREIEQALRNQRLVPDNMVPITHVAAGLDGLIWLGRGPAPPRRQTWQVLASDGSVLATTSLPIEQIIMTSRGDILAALELDSLDVPYLVLYRISRK
jgi:hypothetical protein